MTKLKYYIYLLAVAILIATPVVLFCYFVYTSVGTSTLNSKAITFNTLFFVASGWWYALMNKANELKKYESSLSPTHESFLKLNIDSISNTLWAIIYFNLAGSFATFLTYMLGDSVSVISFSLLSLYFLLVAFLLLILSAPIKSRIENANVLLAKREKEEKKKEEIIKSLKSGLDKFEKDEKFEKYNTVVSIDSENAGQPQ